MDKLILTLNDRCRFHLGDSPDAWQAWFDDSGWEEVCLPHDWSVALPFSREYSSGTGYLAGGIGWYRIRVTPREEWRGKRISVRFDGVYKNSRVWCNSYYLGCRPNGYVSFSYDITEQFHFDRDNILSVCVDHRDISDSRWFTGSGITRKVALTVEEAVHPAADGIFFSAPHTSAERADVLVQNEMINCSGQTAQVRVTNRLLSPQGDLAASSCASAVLEGGQTARIDNRMELVSQKFSHFTQFWYFVFVYFFTRAVIPALSRCFRAPPAAGSRSADGPFPSPRWHRSRSGPDGSRTPRSCNRCW